MKVMPLAMAVVAVAGLSVVSACSKSSDPVAAGPSTAPADADGVKCPNHGKGPKVSAVHIDIAYAMDGTPSADPDQCYVDVGTVITWRDPPDQTTTFNLVFSNGSPTEQGARSLAATQAAGRYKVSITAHGNKGQTYKYGIQANGKTVDPAIIINQ